MWPNWQAPVSTRKLAGHHGARGGGQKTNETKPHKRSPLLKKTLINTTKKWCPVVTWAVGDLWKAVEERGVPPIPHHVAGGWYMHTRVAIRGSCLLRRNDRRHHARTQLSGMLLYGTLCGHARAAADDAEETVSFRALSQLTADCRLPTADCRARRAPCCVVACAHMGQVTWQMGRLEATALRHSGTPARLKMAPSPT